MKKWNRLLALGLSLTLLAACTPKKAEPTPTPEPTPTATPTLEADEKVRVAVLKGVTGLGAAKLMEEKKDSDAMEFSLLADPTEAVAGLSKGEIDIAALPTNLASTLYHKTNGGIQLLSLCAYGVLYVLENGETIQSMKDLEGKTVHAYGQGANPEFVLNYLLGANEVDTGKVDIQWHSSTDEVVTLMASGEAAVCMLPVPAATTVLIQNDKVREALDLTEEWENAEAEGVLTMSCVVARSEFVKNNPEAVDAFLADMEASITFMSDEANREEAAKLAEAHGIIPKAAVAKRALPDANLCFVTGVDMVSGIQGYYGALFAADPASIGGSIPDSDFYYLAGQ